METWIMLRYIAALLGVSPRVGRQPYRGLRPRLEALEDRTLPSNYIAGNVSKLIADIGAANTAGGANTITLTAGATFTLGRADNATDGGNGLPVIAANNNLTIVGNGDLVQRDPRLGSGTWGDGTQFRLFDVAAGATLTLQNLTLQNGVASNFTLLPAQGGAIYSQGTLTLDGVTVQNNTAQPSYGAAQGGAIYSQGTLTLDGGTVQNNSAQAYNLPAQGGAIYSQGTLTLDGGTVQNNTAQGYYGVSAWGGGIYSSGVLTVNGGNVLSNSALGSQGYHGRNAGPMLIGRPWAVLPALAGGAGGTAFGGGLYVADGATATLTGVTLSGNTAKGGNGGAGGNGYNGFYSTPTWFRTGAAGGKGGAGLGGGLYEGAATVALTNCSLTKGNTAQGGAGGAGGTSYLYMLPGSNGGNGGNGFGGGMYVAANGTAALFGDLVTANAANGGAAGSYGVGGVKGHAGSFGGADGGGLYFDALALATLDQLTQAQTTGNTATSNGTTKASDIFGTPKVV
jgi:predicted outer membrane repeat protein